MTQKSLLICLLLILLLAVTPLWAQETVTITVLHSNDFHGASMELLAKRATLIRQIRQETGHPVLVVDAGDVFTRGPYARRFYGALEFAVLNELQYDAVTLGNNEFKATADLSAQDILMQRVRQAAFPLLAANATTAEENYLPGVRPYIIKDYHDFHLAIIGLTSLKARYYSQTKGWRFADPIATCRTITPQLLEKADAAIALTHIGLYQDKQLAKACPGISAVIGGDSHSATFSPVVVGGIPIEQAGAYGTYLGRLDLVFEKTAAGKWILSKYAGKLIKLKDPSLKPDPAVLRIIEGYLKTTRRMSESAGRDIA